MSVEEFPIAACNYPSHRVLFNSCLFFFDAFNSHARTHNTSLRCNLGSAAVSVDGSKNLAVALVVKQTIPSFACNFALSLIPSLFSDLNDSWRAGFVHSSAEYIYDSLVYTEPWTFYVPPTYDSAHI